MVGVSSLVTPVILALCVFATRAYVRDIAEERVKPVEARFSLYLETARYERERADLLQAQIDRLAAMQLQVSQLSVTAKEVKDTTSKQYIEILTAINDVKLTLERVRMNQRP